MGARSARADLLSLIAAACLGCEGVEPQSLPSSRWGAWAFDASAVVPLVYVLTIDDTQGGQALREQSIPALKRTLHMLFETHTPVDASVWREEDVSVILVLPSAEGGARFVGPDVVPALRYRTAHATEAGLDAMADALALALEARLAPIGAPYAPLEATHDLMQLLAAERAPAGAAEQALVDGLAAHGLPPTLQRGVHVAILSSADDASPLPVEAYLSPRRDDFWLMETNAVYTAASPCAPDRPPADRIGAWVALAHRDAGRPCPAVDLEGAPIFEPTWVDRFHGQCASAPVVVDAQGAAQCKAMALLPPDAPGCDPERGQIDPSDAAGAPAFTTRTDGAGTHTYRLCELRQHEGADLAACRTDPSCSGCGSGFCVAPERVDPGACVAPDRDLGIRLTGGALGGGGRVEVTCALTIGDAP